MKITCRVEVRKRYFSADNPRNKKKYSVATLALCHKSRRKELHSDKDAVLILCTQKNPKKRKYKVYDNVDKLFIKFLKDGKATIRFKEPLHDIIISKAHPVQLKVFLHGVDLVLCGEGTGKIHFSPTPIKVDRPKRKLAIMKHRNFRVSGFPQSLTRLLQVNTFFLQKIEERISKLMYLQVLELHHNCIKQLPLALGEIRLKVLQLHHNNIENFPKELSTGMLGQHLLSLDLSYNQIENLSPHFCLMKNLHSLYLQCNKIKKLPRNIHCLESLRMFNIANNELKVLPFSIHKLKLDCLILSRNPLDAEVVSLPIFLRKLPSLLECAASAIVSQKIQYSAQDLPQELIDYLVEHCPCSCGKNVFQNESSCIFVLYHKELASTVVTIKCALKNHLKVPLEVYFCSRKCWRKCLIINEVVKGNKSNLVISRTEIIMRLSKHWELVYDKHQRFIIS